MGPATATRAGSSPLILKRFLALVAGLALSVAGTAVSAQELPPVAVKITSVHFSNAVQESLKGAVTPLQATERWQAALAGAVKFKVLGFDDQVAGSEFGGLLLAASATINKADLFWTAVPERNGGHVAVLVGLTATFMDPATGEIFYQCYVEAASPAEFLTLYDEKESFRLKNIGKYYHTVLDRERASFAKQKYGELVLSGLDQLAREVSRRYSPGLEKGEVVQVGRNLKGEMFVDVSLGFKNGLVPGGVLRIYNPQELGRPVGFTMIERVDAGRARCRIFDERFGRQIREGLWVLAAGNNSLQKRSADTLIFQVMGFGASDEAIHDPLFHVDDDAFSMWLTEDLGAGDEFFLLAPLPSLSSIEDTFEFAEGVEVAEDEIFGRRRIADIGVKGHFFKAAILRSVGGKEGRSISQELELRLSLEFFDIYTGQILFTSETKRVLALEDEIQDRNGKTIVDVSEEVGFRKLARSLIRLAAQDARSKFRAVNVRGKVTRAAGDVLTADLPSNAGVGAKSVLTVWRPVEGGFAHQLGIAVVSTMDGSKAEARFVTAKGVKDAPAEGDEVRVRVLASGGQAGLPLVQVDSTTLVSGIDPRCRLSEKSLAELLHVALNASGTVRAIPPRHRALELESDAALFRDGDFDLDQAEKTLQAKIDSPDYVLRAQLESASVELQQKDGRQSQVFQMKIRVQLLNSSNGSVVFEQAASGKRQPEDEKSQTRVVGGRVVQGLRAEDLWQQYEFLAKDLLDKLVPYVLKKGLEGAS